MECLSDKGDEIRMSEKHDWYVDKSHESEITDKSGWASLGLICIADHDCGKTASVFVDIDPKSIEEDEG